MIVPLRIAAALIGGQRYLMGISNRAPCDSNGEAQQLARLDPVPPARLNEAGDRRLRFTPPLACVDGRKHTRLIGERKCPKIY